MRIQNVCQSNCPKSLKGHHSKSNKFSYSILKGVPILLVLLLFLSSNVHAAIFTAVGTNSSNWNSRSTWFTTPGGTIEGIDFPGPNDDVIIPGTKQVVINISNARCSTLIIKAANGGATSLTFSGISRKLTVNGLFTVEAPSNNSTRRVKIISGTLICGSLNLVSSTGNQRVDITIDSNGLLDVLGDITMGGSPKKNHLSFFQTSTLKLGGNISGGYMDMGSNSIIYLYGSTNQNFPVDDISGLNETKINTGSIYNFILSGDGTTLSKKFINTPLPVSNLITVGANTELVANPTKLITLLASETTNANIGPLLNGAQVTGNLNIQTFLTGNNLPANRGTRSMSSPINDNLIAGDKTYKQLMNSVLITGPGGTLNGFDAGGFAITLANYTEVGNSIPTNFIPVSNIYASTTPGRGYFLFFRGDRTTNFFNKLNAPFATPESVPVNFTGPINKGFNGLTGNDITIPLSYTLTSDVLYDGYNHVGNPFPCTIDWTQVARTTNVLNQVSIVRSGGGTRTWSDGVSNNGGSNIIQSGQGFYVRTNAVGQSVTFSENAKAPALNPTRWLSTPVEKLMSDGSASITKDHKERKILRFNLQDSQNSDETTLVFGNDNLPGYDNWDAIYFAGSTVSLSTLSADNKNLAINFMPGLKDIREIKLNMNAIASGALKLNFTDFIQMDGYQVLLKDALFPDLVKDIKINPVYNFSIDKTKPETFGNQRFSLFFKHQEDVKACNVKNFTAKKQMDGVILSWDAVDVRVVEQFEPERSADGKSFRSLASINSNVNAKNDEHYSFIDNHPLTGINYYRLKQTDLNGEISHSEIKAIEYSLIKIPRKTSVTIYPNPALDEIEIKLAVLPDEQIEFKVLDLQGRVVLSGKLPAANKWRYDVSKLKQGVYILEVKCAESLKLLGRTQFLKGI